MLDGLVKRVVAPLKPWLRRRLGEDYDAWANWAQARVTRLQRRSGHFTGTKVVWVFSGHATLEPFELVGPAPGEVMIETVASGVSPGTEIANFAVLPNTSPQFPSTPGYSALGQVISVGQGVTGFRVGDFVLAPTPHASIATAASTAIAQVPAETPIAASLYMMGVIAYHGVHLAHLEPSESVIVVGRGIIGQFAAQIARLKSPVRIASVARSGSFVGESLRRFCDEVIVLEQGEQPSFEADVTFEVTGSPSALRTAVAFTKPGGRIVLLGSTRGMVDGVDFAEIARKRLTLVGAHTATLTSCAKSGVYDPTIVTHAVADALTSGAMDAGGLVEATVAPEELPAWYLEMADDRSRALGLVVDWRRLDKHHRTRTIGFFHGLSRQKPTQLRPLAAASNPATQARPHVQVAEPPVGIAILGCGVQGKLNAADVLASDGARLAAVMDPQLQLAQRLGDQHGVPAYPDLEAVLADPSVDALFLVTPHHLHRPQVEAAARSGKAVLVEKPLAANYMDAESLVQTAEAAGIPLATWLGVRYTPAYQAAKRLCNAGALGELRGGTLSVQMYKPLSYYKVSGWRAHWETAGGGVLIMNAIHFLDVFLWLAGQPVAEVSCFYSALADSSSEVEDTISLWLRFENGATATVQVSSCTMGTAHIGPEMRLYGQDGSLSLGPTHQVFTIRPNLGVPPGQWSPFEVPGMKAIGVEMVERFSSSVRHGTPMEISGRDGLVVQGVIEAAYRSARERRPVAVSELGGPR